MAFSPDDAWFAVGAKTGITTMWNTDTWEEAGRVGQFGDAPVSSVAFSPDGGRLAIGRSTGVAVADVVSCSRLLSLHDVPDVYDVAFSSDGRPLAASSSDGTVRVWTALGAEPHYREP